LPTVELAQRQMTGTPVMPATLVRNLVADLRPTRRPARVLYAGAAAWLVSGGVPLVCLGPHGGAWGGAVLFRKPLAFSVSIALLLATIGWVLDRLPDRPPLAGTIPRAPPAAPHI